MNFLPYRIVGTGLFALDVLIRLDGSAVAPRLGGSAGNILSILAALGWRAIPVGSVGDDAAGAAVRRDFASVHAESRFLNTSRRCRTPVIYQHQLDRQHSRTHRFSFVCPSCGTRREPSCIDDRSYESLRSDLPPTDVYFFDRPSQLAVELAEHYAEAGALVLFEPSSTGKDRDLFGRAMRSANIVKYSDDRLPELDDADLRDGAVEIQTLGPDGLRFRAPSLDRRWLHLGGYDLPVIGDTSGAGDWCTAGLIFELFKRPAAPAARVDYNALTRALSFGQALSTLNCMTEGARGLMQRNRLPRTVLRQARQLSNARLAAFFAKQVATESTAHEPRLSSWAQARSHQHAGASSDADRFACCPAA
jgi:fructokinase